MKKIYLEEILDDILVEYNSDVEISYEASIKAMKEAIRQALELAAENAKTKIHTVYPLTPMINGTYPISEETIVDKQSILNTINQIE